jgi:hypothetical protein
MEGERMKLNFWQWIGVILILFVIAWIIYDKVKPAGGPTSQPTTKPTGGY